MGSRNIWKRKSTGLVEGLAVGVRGEGKMAGLTPRFLASTSDRSFTKVRHSKRKLRLEGRP